MTKFNYIVSIAAVTLWLIIVGAVSAAHSDGFRIKDAISVPEAVDQIRSTLEGQGFEIIATIQHDAAAASVDLDLRPTTVILASHPFFDFALIRRRQKVAIDLPLKLLVLEDGNGQVQLEINDEGFLVDRHGIRQRDKLLRHLNATLNQFGRQDNGIIKIESNQSVDDTVDKFLALLMERGFRIPIPGGIDFKERARKFRIKLRPTKLIVFGNPMVGTPLMQNDQSIGIDLPQKVLVFKDWRGKVFIAFNDPKFLAKKHNLQRDADPGPVSLDIRLENITNALMGLAEAAANP